MSTGLEENGGSLVAKSCPTLACGSEGPQLCVDVCFVLLLGFFPQTELILNPSCFANFSNITYMCNKMLLKDCMKQN